MRKNAQIFTVLTIVMMALLFISFEVYATIHERQAVKTRVTTMKTFLNSIESNLERQMFISGFRIIFLAEAEITTTGEYVDVESFFEEAFFNGTVNGEENNTILEGATYDDIIESINAKASKINININMTNPQIIISQPDPWNVKITLNTDFTLNDNEGLARWEKVQSISALIPVEGFEDPIFTIEARVPRQIYMSPYDGYFNSSNDVSNLSLHFSQNYYVNDTDAPSFLMRLEGNLSSNPNGIESFVKVNDIYSQGISIDTEKSVVDHLYFSPGSYQGITVSGMPADFKINTAHMPRYQLAQ